MISGSMEIQLPGRQEGNVTGSPDDHEAEVEEVRWFDFEAVQRVVGYPTEVGVLAQAGGMLAAKTIDRQSIGASEE